VGLFLSIVPSTADLRLTDQEFLQNYWHRFGLLGALQVLADRSCASTCREFPPRRLNEITDTFRSGAHALQCFSCGTLKRHNAVLKGPIAANLNKQGYTFNIEHIILDDDGKKAGDAYVTNPYVDEPKTIIDVTISCPTCPTYICNAAAATNDHCTKLAEKN